MWKKALLCLVAVVLLGAGGTFGYLWFRSPASAPPSTVKVEATPARLARGKYIFEVVADCAGCHSQRDWSKFGGPVVPAGLGKGFAFPPELGLPGEVYAPNITPDPETGIGAWTDGEKIRAIREGISKDGRALFPFMPYTFFRHMSDEDVYSLVVYMDSLPPIKNRMPRTRLNFPVNLFIKSAPRPVNGTVPEPDRSNRVKYGEYLVTIGSCMECHTQAEKGQLLLDKKFGGGREFRFGSYQVVTANITPDQETGLGAWSEERFVNKFLNFKPFADGSPPAVSQANFTLMPWLNLSHMDPEDLRAMYAFLRTVPPLTNKVETHPPSGS